MKDLMQQTVSRIAGRTASLLTAACLLALILLVQALPARRVEAGNSHHGNPLTLAGSWRIDVTEPSSTFFTYETFTEAGGSVEVNRPGGFNTSIGAWTRTGPRKFLATFYKPVFKVVEVNGQPTYQLEITVKARRLITLSSDGNALTGVATVEIYDPAGNLVATAPTHTLRGARIVPEPPDLRAAI